MNEEKLCDSCVKLLSGNRDRKFLTDDATHHNDAESFRRALQLPCYLCCFAWARPFDATMCVENLPDGTKHSFFSDFMKADNDADTLWFQLHPEGSYPLKLEPWQSS